MKVTVCIGSSCHIKGSRQVVEGLQYYISEAGLGDKVELGGTFCMGKCQLGVCVTVDGEFFSVTPETVKDFFDKEIKAGDTATIEVYKKADGSYRMSRGVVDSELTQIILYALIAAGGVAFVFGSAGVFIIATKRV